MADRARALVARESRLRDVPGLPGVRLHLADDVRETWRAVQLATGDPDAPLPYWSVAWGGGLAIAHWLVEHPGAVAGRRVLDLAAGSGLCGVVAAQLGADRVRAVDIDPFAIAAIARNAQANHVRVETLQRDVFDDEGPPADTDVVLAGDCWYEPTLAARALPWLQRAAAAGIDVIVGDPGRADLPEDALLSLATYQVRTTSDREDLRFETAGVYRLPGERRTL